MKKQYWCLNTSHYSERSNQNEELGHRVLDRVSLYTCLLYGHFFLNQCVSFEAPPARITPMRTLTIVPHFTSSHLCCIVNPTGTHKVLQRHPTEGGHCVYHVAGDCEVRYVALVYSTTAIQVQWSALNSHVV